MVSIDKWVEHTVWVDILFDFLQVIAVFGNANHLLTVGIYEVVASSGYWQNSEI